MSGHRQKTEYILSPDNIELQKEFAKEVCLQSSSGTAYIVSQQVSNTNGVAGEPSLIVAGPTNPLTSQRTLALAPVKFDDEPLQLECEWKGCNLTTSNMTDFMDHVSAHVPVFSIERNEDENPDIVAAKPLLVHMTCQWKNCPWSTDKSYQPEFQRHLYMHAYHTKLKCIGRNTLNRCRISPCAVGTENQNILPDLSDNLQCAWDECCEKFVNIQMYYDHIRSHCEDNPKGHNLENRIKCKWAGCSSTYPNITKLRDHMRSHTQEKLLACPVCGGLFSNRTRFFDHCRRQVLLEDQSFACSVCMKCFSTARLLRDHIRSHVNSYKCPHCEMSCSAPSALNSHIRFRHSNDRPFQCDYCSYSAKAQNDLNRHTKIHTNPTYICEEGGCDFNCKSMTTLSYHYMKEHNVNDSRRKYLCHLCSKRFNRGYYLTKHLINCHQLQWPAGHSRLRYKIGPDGFYRLQTVRYESLDVSSQNDSDDEDEEEAESILPD